MNKNLRKKKKGFTLIELIVVIAILGILAGIAVPRFSNSTVKAANVAHNANIRTIQSAAMMYMAENAIPTDGLDAATSKTNVEKYLQGWPTVPSKAQSTDSDGKLADMPADPEYTITISGDGVVVIAPNPAPAE